MVLDSTPVQNMDLVQLNFPNADIHVKEGSVHVVQYERADEVNALIDDFVSDRSGKEVRE